MPYRDPYADDAELDEGNLGNEFDEDEAEKAANEEEFVSSVEETEEEEETDEEKEEVQEEASDEEETVDEEEPEEEEVAEDGDSDRGSEDNSESDTGNEGKEPRIPQGRFNEVYSRAKQAEERSERLERLLEQTIAKISGAEEQGEDGAEDEPEINIAEVEKEILSLAFAGEEEKAVQKRLELDAYKEKQWAKKYSPPQDLDTTLDTMLEQRAQQAQLAVAVQKSQEAYPVLKEGHESYDQALVDEINRVWDGLATTMPPAEALTEAVEFIAVKKGLTKEGESEVDDPKAKSKGRKKAAVKKNADAQKSQPPKMRGRSAKDDSLDEVKASKLSDKKLFSMSEKELRILRGD